MNGDVERMLSSVPAVLRPLLPEVCTALRESLARASQALGRGDMEGVRLAAHGLKGASMRFGLTALSLAASEMEQVVEQMVERGAGASEPEAEAIRAGLTRFVSLLAELEDVL